MKFLSQFINTQAGHFVYEAGTGPEPLLHAEDFKKKESGAEEGFSTEEIQKHIQDYVDKFGNNPKVNRDLIKKSIQSIGDNDSLIENQRELELLANHLETATSVTKGVDGKDLEGIYKALINGSIDRIGIELKSAKVGGFEKGVPAEKRDEIQKKLMTGLQTKSAIVDSSPENVTKVVNEIVAEYSSSAGGESIASLGLENLTKEEAGKIIDNREKLGKAVQKELGEQAVDTKIYNDSFNQVLKGQSKEKLIDENFVLPQQEAVITAIEQNNAWASVKTAKAAFPKATPEQQQALSQGIEGLNGKVLKGLRNQKKDGRQVSIPGVGSHSLDPKIESFISDQVEALVQSVKAKTPEEALSALENGHKAIIEAVITSPIVENIKTESVERSTSKTLSNEALATGIVGGEYEGSEQNLNLRDGSILKTADLHIGEPAKDISFPDDENLRTIGAGDLYPPEVRQISVNGKIANREGVGGSFFYEGGEYASIINGDKVVINKMANNETEEGKALAKDLEAMRKERASAVEKFQFKVEAGNDKEIEIAPGKVFKQSELVAQMSERYGLDPNLLMQEASGITSGGSEYLKDINMMARSMQKDLMSSGIPKKDWFVEKNGRRYMNPKALSGFVGGNKDHINKYVESSGAQYSEKEIEALEGSDGLTDFPEKGKMTGENAKRLAAVLNSRFDNSGKGSMKTMEGGINGMQIESARALLSLDTAMRSSTGYNGPKGVLNSVTGGKHGGGEQSHKNGFKVDVRCNPNLGSSAAYGQAMWDFVSQKGTSMGADKSGNQRYSVNLPGGDKAWVYRHPPDHLDIKLVSQQQYAANKTQFNKYT